MTFKQLEERVEALEREVVALRQQMRPLQPLQNVAQTFGMFANDPDFDEVIRLGREYRQQANAEEL